MSTQLEDSEDVKHMFLGSSTLTNLLPDKMQVQVLRKFGTNIQRTAVKLFSQNKLRVKVLSLQFVIFQVSKHVEEKFNYFI